MTILDKIIERKKEEVAAAKLNISQDELVASEWFGLKVPSLKSSLLDPEKSGVITEFKRQSPSKGVINGKAKVAHVVKAYESAGASGLSVLTDTDFFGGTYDDLRQARAVTSIPILRKDFMIDPYQVYEAKAMGASAILLIAACLSNDQAKELGAMAHYLGLEVLMELHDERELKCLNPFVDVVGINNRNLKTFEVSLSKSVQLANLLPKDKIKISESGIHSKEDVFYLRENGFEGFLIGENFMKTEDPGQSCIDFCQSISKQQINS